MSKLMRACSVVFVSLCSLFYMVHVMASESEPTVTFIGKYTFQGKPALIVQFDQSIRQADADKVLSKDKIAQIFSIRLVDGKRSDAADRTVALNTDHTAVIYDQLALNQRYRISLFPDIKSDVGQEAEVTIYERLPQINLLDGGQWFRHWEAGLCR
ncbi:hypothetical protein P4S72_25840 [Vibrio sp. PP-XX7]